MFEDEDASQPEFLKIKERYTGLRLVIAGIKWLSGLCLVVGIALVVIGVARTDREGVGGGLGFFLIAPALWINALLLQLLVDIEHNTRASAVFGARRRTNRDE